MKYIRTKDGIFENKPLEKHFGKRNGKGYEIVFKEQDIISQANTIEELCDEFVVVEEYEKYREMYFYTDEDDAKAFFSCNTPKERLKLLIYGAIHIEDKGLIYVAKLNEQGELELL